MNMWGTVLASAALVAAFTVSDSVSYSSVSPVEIETYPNRPIKLVVPLSPGGVIDVFARQWAERATPRLGAIYVENHAGAAGVVAANLVGNAEPDGYTVLFGYVSRFVRPPKNLTLVAVVSSHMTAIIENPKSTSAAFGSAGFETPSYVMGAAFNEKRHLGMVHVPYKGGSQVIVDLIAGRIAFAALAVTQQILDLQDAGVVRVIAEDQERIEHGLFVPLGTPEAVVRKLCDDGR